MSRHDGVAGDTRDDNNTEDRDFAADVIMRSEADI